MAEPRPTAAPLIPSPATIPSLRDAAARCRACPLWKRGTQTVFGEGPEDARVLAVGEQPGNAEDLAGRPFVGPAGGLLSKALEAAGVDRSEVYVTNAVKHFKWEPAGKRRIHKKPNSLEIGACRPWLDAEIAAIEPEFILCLGATAAQALLGRQFRVSVDRGRLIEGAGGRRFLATVHPSSILRAPDDETRRVELHRFIADLKVLARALRAPRATPGGTRSRRSPARSARSASSGRRRSVRSRAIP
jgi:uracil-DNA glycosylase family protein